MIRKFHSIEVDPEKLAAFCRRHGIHRLSLFGSILGADFRADSDVDVLLEFPPGQTPSLMELGGMQVELSEMLGCEVDLKTLGFISPRIRRIVLSEAQVQYAA